jgi:hypothetical protein
MYRCLNGLSQRSSYLIQAKSLGEEEEGTTAEAHNTRHASVRNISFMSVPGESNQAGSGRKYEIPPTSLQSLVVTF